jgi:hypothetical protein
MWYTHTHTHTHTERVSKVVRLLGLRYLQMIKLGSLVNCIPGSLQEDTFQGKCGDPNLKSTILFRK